MFYCGMSESDTGYDVSEFERECRAGKNRLAELCLREVSTREATRNGQTLTSGDLVALAIVVEEEQSLDSLLGLYIDGVSRSVVCELMDVNRSSGKYRFDKLENANLIEVYEADSLPVSSRGSDPTYAVATEVGRKMVDNMGLLPILTRDRDLEEQFDMLVSDYMKMREEFIRTLGRQVLLVQQLSDDEADDLGEFSFDAMGNDLIELGESMTVADLPSRLSLSDDEYAFGKLLGEMDEEERELMLRELLDEKD